MSSKKQKDELRDALNLFVKKLESAGILDGSIRDDRRKDAGSHYRRVSSLDDEPEEQPHRLGKNVVCRTDERGFARPGDRAPTDIVLDASEGFIPLWRFGTTLRWCFDEVALNALEDGVRTRTKVRKLIEEAMMAWGDSAPIKLKEERDSYDFRVVVHGSDDCTPFGCTLARAFFPDSGRHKLEIFPRMFEQTRKEQIDTVTHELGHVFGLRHFFAQIRETRWPSVIFGEHRPFTIMNYGDQSELTQDDRDDLKRLYHAVWSGGMAEINGTPIRLFAPYHEAGEAVTPRFSLNNAAQRR